MNKLGVVSFLGLVTHVLCQMPGAPVEAGVNDEKVQEMASFAVREIGSEYTLSKVISGTKQVVNGMLYNIHLEATRKVAGKKNKNRRCNVLVYEILHQKYLELEEFNCHFTNKRPQL